MDCGLTDMVKKKLNSLCQKCKSVLHVGGTFTAVVKIINYYRLGNMNTTCDYWVLKYIPYQKL